MGRKKEDLYSFQGNPNPSLVDILTAIAHKLNRRKQTRLEAMMITGVLDGLRKGEKLDEQRTKEGEKTGV